MEGCAHSEPLRPALPGPPAPTCQGMQTELLLDGPPSTPAPNGPGYEWGVD